MDLIIRVSLFIFLLFSSFPLGFSVEKTPEHVIYANEIVADFTKEMEEKYGLICIGNSGSMPDTVRSIGAEFQLFRRATTEEARLLEALAVERLCEMINNNTKIRPYLCEFPFPHSRADVAISFYSPSGNRLSDGNISFVFQAQGKLFYCTKDPFINKLVDKFDESFEEAKKFVKASPNVNPITHQEKAHEPLIDAVFAAYLKEMHEDYRFEIDAIGGRLVDGVEEVVARLIYFHPTNMEKARQLHVIATERLLYLINTNEELRPYIKEYPLSLDNLKVSVLFRKKNYFPYYNGSMERTSQVEDQIFYYQKTPVDENAKGPAQPRETPLYAKESYQEALNKVEGSRAVKKMRVKRSSK